MWSAPVVTSHICDLCRVRVDVRWSHPRPSVVTAPVYRDPVSRVRPHQSANSCLRAGVQWCVVHVVVLSLWKVPSLRLLDSLSHLSSTWSRLWSCRSSGASHHWRSVTTDLHSTTGWTFCSFASDANSSASSDRVGVDSKVKAVTLLQLFQCPFESRARCCPRSCTHQCSDSTRPHAACLAANWSAPSHGDEHHHQQSTRGPDRDSPSVVIPFRLIDASVSAPCFFGRPKSLYSDLVLSSVLSSSLVRD